MSRIITIGTAVPPFGVKQDKILEFMDEAYSNETASRKLNALFTRSGIGMRYSSLPDFANTGNYQLFKPQSDIPHVRQRMEVFRENALALAGKAVKRALDKINTSVSEMDFTHILTVTCTGIYAPGIDAYLTEKLNLKPDVFRLGINFLGCNAAFHALKVADLICSREPSSRVLIVCVELCTLHFQPRDSNDDLLANTIFGDGAAALVVLPDETARRHQFKGLDIHGLYSVLYKEGRGLMAWDISPVNFEMVLDAKLADFIGEILPDFMISAATNLRIERKIIDYWAVHPGGKRILDVFMRILSLPEEKLSSSYKILREYGNMSSPTVLFVLEEIADNLARDGEYIFSLGFGPGISVDSALYSYAG